MDGFFELRLPSGLRLGDPAEVALEDYARAVTGSLRVEAVRGVEPGAAVVAVRLWGLEREPAGPAAEDVAAFARELALAREASGLGWS